MSAFLCWNKAPKQDRAKAAIVKYGEEELSRRYGRALEALFTVKERRELARRFVGLGTEVGTLATVEDNVSVAGAPWQVMLES